MTQKMTQVEKAVDKIKAERPDLPIRARAFAEYDEDPCSETGAAWYVCIVAVKYADSDDPLGVSAVMLRADHEDEALAMVASVK